jgi:hypothetical protein
MIKKKKITTRRIAINATVIAAFIGGFFLIANTIINKKVASSEKKPADKTVVSGNQNTIINGDSNTVIGSLTINKSEQQNNSPITQSFSENISVTPENKYLYKVLSKHYKFNISRSSMKKVAVTVTGDISKLTNSDLYTYSGGQIALFVNDNICHIFSELAVKETSKYGNSKSKIEEYIMAIIEQNININSNLIAKQINKCVRQ